jgi:hypothetical protein
MKKVQLSRESSPFPGLRRMAVLPQAQNDCGRIGVVTEAGRDEAVQFLHDAVSRPLRPASAGISFRFGEACIHRACTEEGKGA